MRQLLNDEGAGGGVRLSGRSPQDHAAAVLSRLYSFRDRSPKVLTVVRISGIPQKSNDVNILRALAVLPAVFYAQRLGRPRSI
jgi:hypothetical protein